MKNFIFTLVTVFLSIFTTTAQNLFEAGVEEPYNYGDITIKINNWDLFRNDWNQQDFQAAIGLNPTAITSSNQDFFEEFGFTQKTYNFNGDTLSVSGSALVPNAFYVDSFELNTPLLNVNGIKVGDPLNSVLITFVRNYLRSDYILVYYEDDAIAFHYLNGVITKITFYTPV